MSVRLIDWLIDWLVDWLVEWLIDWLICWLVDRLIDWLIYIGGSTCTIPASIPNMVVYHSTTRVNFSDSFGQNATVFTESTELLFHCEHLGTFQLTGPPRIVCLDGVWSAPLPACTNLLPDSTTATANELDRLNLPPAILYHKTAGITGIGRTGELLVYPSTDLQLDCVWKRTDGTPSWTVSHQFRVYPKGNQSINQSINQSLNQSINQLINQSIGLWINLSINQSINQSINRSMDQSINQMVSRSATSWGIRHTFENFLCYKFFSSSQILTETKKVVCKTRKK